MTKTMILVGAKDGGLEVKKHTEKGWQILGWANKPKELGRILYFKKNKYGKWVGGKNCMNTNFKIYFKKSYHFAVENGFETPDGASKLWYEATDKLPEAWWDEHVGGAA